MLAYLIVFAGGVLTSMGLWNVATIPLIVGLVGGSHDLSRRRAFLLSFSFAIGLAITFMLLGVSAALVGLWIGSGNCLLPGSALAGYPDHAAANQL